MSFLFARDKPQITGTYPSSKRSFPTIFAMLRTASRSSGDAIGNPASMMSTPSFARLRAMSSFSLDVSVAPGVGTGRRGGGARWESVARGRGGRDRRVVSSSRDRGVGRRSTAPAGSWLGSRGDASGTPAGRIATPWRAHQGSARRRAASCRTRARSSGRRSATERTPGAARGRRP
eukprot:19486-Pelagococcus_subviridis.AAC.1